MTSHPNCKINLGLHVVRRRADGYHDLETVFVPVPLCDELEITPSASFDFRQEGIAIAGGAEDNIVVKAYRLMQHEYGERVGAVAIRLRKEIPFGAGLGGGSSDAALALRMIDSLFGLQLGAERLKALAARLGADCAFFIDNVPAYATGIGDRLSPLGFNPLEGHTLLLVKPDEAVGTAEAYRGIVPRERRGDTAPVDLIQAVRRPVSEWRKAIVNDFEETVFQSHPRLAELKAALYAEGATYAAMSGSGSTLYALVPDKADCAAITQRLAPWGNTYCFKNIQ